MKVKFLQSFINKLGGVAMFNENEYMGKHILFIDNKQKYWYIRYEKGHYKDRGYRIIEDKEFGIYENNLNYTELKKYLEENIFKED